MPQTGTAGDGRFDRRGAPMPPPVVAFDPVGEIVAVDHRAGARAARRSPETTRAARTPASREQVHDNAAAARAAMADAFAARFGVDETGPTADMLADRFDLRYETSDAGTAGGRRTVTITGHGAARAVPPAERTLHRGGRRGASGPRESFWLQADRAALWAVGLALVLALLAAMSAHALPLI